MAYLVLKCAKLVISQIFNKDTVHNVLKIVNIAAMDGRVMSAQSDML